jgi:23S rRNA (guanosine2251-2'-O)-methyltransferase
MNAFELRHGNPETHQSRYKQIPKTGIYIICDEVQDPMNLGMVFRLADSLGANEVMITGNSVFPNDKRVQKTAVNTTRFVDWTYSVSAVQAIENVRGMVEEIIALELTDKATDFDRRYYPMGGVAIVIGNEEKGIKPETLAKVDSQVKIPMWGINHSLNVAVSLGIFGHHLLSNRSPFK